MAMNAHPQEAVHDYHHYYHNRVNGVGIEAMMVPGRPLWHDALHSMPDSTLSLHVLLIPMKSHHEHNPHRPVQCKLRHE